MDEQQPATFSELTRRLFRDANDVARRLALADAPLAGTNQVLCSPQSGEVIEFFRTLIERRDPVLVYGDYDVDGSISAFLMHRWLKSAGVPGNFFLPSRFKHGYGLDIEVLRQAKDQNYRALIALDCGTTNLEEIAYARSAGFAVLVIDHHSPKEQLPDALLLNPHLCPGMPAYCTAGLVYETLVALDSQLRPGSLQGDEIELAGLATIADVVDLEPANWLLAHQALLRLPESTNLGISELIKISGLHGLTRLTSRQLAFQLVPRLNAAGRMRNARLVVELLLAADATSARQMAQQLESLNNARKEAAQTTFAQALLLAAGQPRAAGLALYDPRWHIGVLGIVAAKISEHQAKPTIIFTSDPAAPGQLSGSARSAGGIDLIDVLNRVGDKLISFGGHADAAGVKVSEAGFAEFQDAWSAAVAASEPRKQADYGELPELRLQDISAEFEHDVWRLSPFGSQHVAPRCVLVGCRVKRVSHMGRDKLHLNILLEDGVRQMRIAAFEASHLYERLRPGSDIRPVIEFEADNWNNILGISVRLIELQ